MYQPSYWYWQLTTDMQLITTNMILILIPPDMQVITTNMILIPIPSVMPSIPTDMLLILPNDAVGTNWHAVVTTNWHAVDTTDWDAVDTTNWHAVDTTDWHAVDTINLHAVNTTNWHAVDTTNWHAVDNTWHAIDILLIESARHSEPLAGRLIWNIRLVQISRIHLHRRASKSGNLRVEMRWLRGERAEMLQL